MDYPQLAKTASQAYDRVLKDVSQQLNGVRPQRGFEDAMRQVADEYFSLQRVEHQLNAMLTDGFPWRQADFRGKTILDIGANSGAIVSYLTVAWGANAIGIEPFGSSCHAAWDYWQLLQDETRLFQATGEKMPFADETFDLVTSFNVIEHVQDPAAVMREGWRVLKPGGIWFSSIPSYATFWEGHYAIPWIPYLNKPLGRAYVRLWGRDPAYVDDLQLITVPRLKGIINTLPNAKILGWGKHLFYDRLTQQEFQELSGMEGLGQVVSLLRRSKLAAVLGQTLNALNLFTPISLTIHKTA